MGEEIIKYITNIANRKSLYHFTRAKNLDSILFSNALYSSYAVNPNPIGERRDTSLRKELKGKLMILNSHLPIANSMMDPDTSLNQFRTFLDKHVFFWPTLRNCQKMIGIYGRREPNEEFVVLKFDAYLLLRDYYKSVRLSKYDSGSMPRYPSRCLYRKSLKMFLPLDEFKRTNSKLVPTKPSEIYEILISEKVGNLDRYLQAIYSTVANPSNLYWKKLHRSWAEISPFELK
jgi:hypothetical protein